MPNPHLRLELHFQQSVCTSKVHNNCKLYKYFCVHNLLFLLSSAAHPGHYTAFWIHPAAGSSNDTAGGCQHINISHLCKVRNLEDIESLALA